MADKMAVVSGGLDSCTMLWTMLCSGYDVDVITFGYGQKHQIEIEYAKRFIEHCRKFFKQDIYHHIIYIPTLPGSALTDSEIEVPKEDYSVESQKLTVVPNRNMVFLAIAASYGIAYKCNELWYAAHKNDQVVYRDCRPQFVNSMNIALHDGNDDSIVVVAPFIDMRKFEIIDIGSGTNMPFGMTWSCYDPVTTKQVMTNRGFTDPETIHCGVCGTCRERKMAFKITGTEDPTRYAK